MAFEGETGPAKGPISRFCRGEPMAAPPLLGPDTTETGATVSWQGPDEPIVLTVHGPGSEVSTSLTPKRALALAAALAQRAVLTIKTNQWGSGWPG